jgi:hypothetical protein
MASSDVFALPHSELNPFLYANVATEKNGTTLSLMSVFARLGEDPWREAARLVGLPRSDAIASLARTLAGMPTSDWTLPDATQIATRLIALLPSRNGAATPLGPARWPAIPRRLLWNGLLLVALTLGMAYAMGMMTSRPAPQPFEPGGPVSSSATTPR